MTQPESRLSNDIQNALRAEGVFCFKVHGSEFMQAGLPDIIACVDGKFLGLEVKMPGKRHNVSNMQKHRREEILRAGGECVVVTSIREALNIMKIVRAANR